MSSSCLFFYNLSELLFITQPEMFTLISFAYIARRKRNRDRLHAFTSETNAQEQV